MSPLYSVRALALLAPAAFIACFNGGCRGCVPSPVPSTDGSAQLGSVGVENATKKNVTVYVAFGADSVVTPSSWAVCGADGGLNCSFSLPAQTTMLLATGGQYLNATFSFNAPVACGVTKTELNLNNPKWYDTVDISLVDGFSNAVSLRYNEVTLGPVTSATGNEKALGVYPAGCDLCVARSAQTPCGMTPGTDGCKSGSQYDPSVPCQYQGLDTGGANVVIHFLGN